MKKNFLFALIFFTAFWFRFNNLNWDNNFHLHPDERFLTMVGGAMSLPRDFFGYLNPETSTFNPVNIGHKFYVYGTFPVVLNKLFAIWLKFDTYNDFTILGRGLSALADFLVVILVYKTAQLLEKKYKYKESFKYWAAFLYAIAVLPIQLAHFFTVDSFLNFFVFASFYFALRFALLPGSKPLNLCISAIMLGLGLGSKISAVFIFPLTLILILIGIFEGKVKGRKIHLVRWDYALWYGLIAYFILRIADPYYFQSSNFLNLMPNTFFVENLKALRSLEDPAVWFPPSVQWLHKPKILFSLQNLAVYGVGLPYFLLSIYGMFSLFRSNSKNQTSKLQSKNKNEQDGIILKAALFWVIAFFLYYSTRVAQTMRYFILIYPFLALFGAVGIQKILNSQFSIFKKAKLSTRKIIIVTLVLIWPVAFSSIYLRDHSRVEASKWIYQNIPTGQRILSEHWDDALPLPVIENVGQQYTITELPVFDQDTPEKWQKMEALLKENDYYILSSNRGWGSMPTVPERYPLMTKFYEDLFAGRLSYKKIKEFHSYPSIGIGNFKIEIPDSTADESFTVYDHPVVMIFKKTSE